MYIKLNDESAVNNQNNKTLVLVNDRYAAPVFGTGHRIMENRDLETLKSDDVAEVLKKMKILTSIFGKPSAVHVL